MSAPSGRSFDRDHRSAAGGGQHRAVESHADHDVRGDIAVSDPVVVVALTETEDEEEDNRHDEREDHRAPIAGQATKFQSQ